MPDVNDEMKAVADYAIKSARERFKQDLDYSEESIARLENILEKIYWGFSNRSSDGGEGGLIFNTAIIWGSYLGEYMRLKWGGTWALKGSDRILSIMNIEFSPVNLVYQKITGRPSFSLEDYLNEAKRVIYRSAVNPQEAKYQPKKVERFTKEISVKPARKPFTINKQRLIPFAGIGAAVLIVIAASIVIFRNIKAGGLSGFGLVGDATSENADAPGAITSFTSTTTSTGTQVPTATDLPTSTPTPTATPTVTSSPTYTASPTFTPTETQLPTDTPTLSPTPIPRRTRTPTPTEEPTEEPPPPTQPPPPPTQPPPPPPELVGCDVSPSTVPAGVPTELTFTVQFTVGGYAFDVSLNPGRPDSSGCSGTADSNGTGMCTGNSGLIESGGSVEVICSSSVGSRSASVSAQ